MSITSPLFYFVLMGLFLLEGKVLSHFLTFHKELNTEELKGNHLLALDGLRGVLALSVFFCHASLYFYFSTIGLWTYQPSNFYGQLGVFAVTLFFFITGYLFWSKLKRTGHIPAFEFYWRRLGRLGPVYVFACCVFFLLVAVVSHLHRNESFARVGAEAALWLGFLSANHDVNGIVDSRYWLGPAWSLRYEWLFYLSLPFLGWFARKRFGLALLMAIAAVLVILSSIIHLHGEADWLQNIFAPYPFYLLFVFSGGMLVPQLNPTAAWVRRLQSPVATLTSLALIGLVLFFVTPVYGWLESLCLMLPFICICFGNNWFGLLTSAPLRFLGRISYSFYLLHMPILIAGTLVIKRFFNITAHGAAAYWACLFLCGAVTVFAASFSYQYLEHPFLHLGKLRTIRVAKRTAYPLNAEGSLF